MPLHNVQTILISYHYIILQYIIYYAIYVYYMYSNKSIILLILNRGHGISYYSIHQLYTVYLTRVLKYFTHA